MNVIQFYKLHLLIPQKIWIEKTMFKILKLVIIETKSNLYLNLEWICK